MASALADRRNRERQSSIFGVQDAGRDLVRDALEVAVLDRRLEDVGMEANVPGLQGIIERSTINKDDPASSEQAGPRLLQGFLDQVLVLVHAQACGLALVVLVHVV